MDAKNVPFRAGNEAQNEREKGEKHFPIFDAQCGCVAHVFDAETAKLFAAAPELLEALKEWLKNDDEAELVLRDIGVPAGPEHEIITRARSAVAKAEGKPI